MQALASLRHLNGQEVELYVPERGASGEWQLTRRMCRICMMVLAADYPERCLMCGCRAGAETAYPCTTCQCPKEQLGDPLFGARGLPLRAAAEEQERRARLTAALNGRAHGAVGPARKEATEQSMHITGGPLALEGLDLGEHARGVSPMHAAVPPDWLHVVYEGIGKEVVAWVCQLAQVRCFLFPLRAFYFVCVLFIFCACFYCSRVMFDCHACILLGAYNFIFICALFILRARFVVLFWPAQRDA